MNKLIIATIGMILISGQAFASNKCDKTVLTSYKNYIEKKTENDFDGVRRVESHYATDMIKKSQELSIEEKVKALKNLNQPGVLVYEGASSYMSGTGLEILIVNAKTCKITQKVFWYAE